jgi:hypothetical protein
MRIMNNYPPQSGNRPGCWRLSVYVVVLALCMLSPARAGLIGDYAPSNFQLVNTGADGFSVFASGGMALVLTGGNTGSGLAGTTDLTTVAAGTGTVSFQYSYSSLDFPGADSAGYLLNGTYFQLASIDGICGTALCPGTAQFAVSAGARFGWRIETADNIGEPGILTVTQFNAPSATQNVPEPSSMPILLSLAVAAMADKFRRRCRKQRSMAQ